jgi:hypothetical protein
MAQAVYTLCAVTSVACAVMLILAYRSARSRLLLWSSLCFVALAANNVLLLVDLVVVPAIDLSMVRTGIAVAGLSTLVFGLVWDVK